MRSVEAVPTQSVVTRVITLPLVSSAYDILSSVYSHAKDNHPYVKSVCEVAEMGMKTITSVALTGAKPIFGKLELQLALANDLACKGLDKIEETLPILHKPSDQVVATARDVMTVKVTGVSQTLTGVVDKTKEAVQDSVVITRAVVHSGVSSVMCSRIVELVSTGVDTALSRSEILVDQYLPLTDEELEREAKMVKGFEGISQKSSYYVRLGSLSLKLRTRAYRQAVAKVRGVKHSSQESISQLQHVMDLIESTKKNIDGANQKLHDKVHSWVEWQKAEQGRGDDNHNSDAEHIESRTLTIAHNLTHQLQITCVTLVSSLQGLPQNIQNQALSVAQSATDIYNHVGKASTFKDLSDSVLTRSKAQLSKMKDSLDGIMDYLVNNTPLNWLVPDIAIADHVSAETERNDPCAQSRVHIRVKTLRPLQ